MYTVQLPSSFQTWPLGWAIYILTYDSIVELLSFPRDVLAYIADVLWSLVALPGHLLRSAEPPEPPYLSNGVPLLGHLWGIFTKGSDYVKMLEYVFFVLTKLALTRRSQKYRLPLFAMNVPGYRVYVATTPEAVRAIHKNPKTMEFTEIQKIAMRKLFYYPEEAIDTLGVHLNGDGTLKLINKPGPELDEVNEKGQVELVKQMKSLNDGVMPLCLTLRRKLTLSICAALWGPQYPLLHDSHLEEDFWTWVDHFWSLLILPAHDITVSKGHAARERLCAALLQYTRADGHSQASQVVSAEYHLYISLGLGEDIIARAGTVSLFVVLSNTVMAGLWLVMIIFSKPDLLQQIRGEVFKCITTSGSHTQYVINTTKLKTECPVLLATFREMLRHYMDFSLNRWVGDDTQVRLPTTDQTFSLKKGSIVQVASPLIQMQESVWGVDTNDFKPCRFMAGATCPADTRTKVYGVNNRTSVPDPARPAHVTKDQKTAFSAFGGGAHVCPGRHFAFHIIAAFTAVIVSGYDIAGADGQLLVIPETEKSLGHGIKLPHGDVAARVTKRAGYEDADWSWAI